MIRQGIRMWKRAALPALVFMILSAFLWMQAYSLNRELAEDIEQHGRLTCMLEGREQSGAVTAYLEQMNGSYVYEREEVIRCRSIEKTYPVTGISVKMIPGERLTGSLYADESDLFSIVINKAALDDLLGREVKTVEEIEEWVSKTLTMGQSAVEVIGVTDDGTMLPKIYMSIPAIRSYIQRQGEAPQADLFYIDVPGLERMEQVQTDLAELGIRTDIEHEKILDWKLKQLQASDLRMMSALVFGGFLSSILLTVKIQKQKYNGIDQSVLFVAVIANVVVGATVGVLMFAFVQLWRI